MHYAVYTYQRGRVNSIYGYQLYSIETSISGALVSGRTAQEKARLDNETYTTGTHGFYAIKVIKDGDIIPSRINS